MLPPPSYNHQHFVEKKNHTEVMMQNKMNGKSHPPHNHQNYSNPNAHFRSAAEATLDSSSKYRQLPCKTLISVGTCPYGDRCVFLHDPRLICHLSTSISRLKNKEDTVIDSFFWPLASHLDASTQNRNDNNNFRNYSVPAPKADQYMLHDQSLYSLWMHYVEFCRMTGKGQKSRNSPVMKPQDVPTNLFTHRKRLPVFQLLSSSNGQAIRREQFEVASYAKMRSMSLDGVAAQPEGLEFTPPMNAKPVSRLPLHMLSPTSVNDRLSFTGAYGDSVSGAAMSAKMAMAQHQQQQMQMQQKQQQDLNFNEYQYNEEHKFDAVFASGHHQQQQQQPHNVW